MSEAGKDLTLVVSALLALVLISGALPSYLSPTTNAIAIPQTLPLIRCITNGDHYETNDNCDRPLQRYDTALGYVFRQQKSGTQSLLRCVDGPDFYTAPHCGGHVSLQNLGYVYTQPQEGTIPLYQCYRAQDHYLSLQEDCEQGTYEGIMGYVLNQP